MTAWRLLLTRPAQECAALAQAYDRKFTFLFEQLAVSGTRKHVERFVMPPVLHKPQPKKGQVTVAAAPDDTSLSD